ncbi:hypothetical protein B6D60_11305 [candidate division KSB1 bacterium 4484_87]|nr:MAG: hypothetical protein B6D60_11305 [candidate division KSB1 bacterium 4484_87]
MIWQSLKYGISQVWGNKRLIAFYYLLNLLLAFFLILPLHNVLNDFAGRSLMGAKLAESFDMNLFFELIHEHGDVLSLWMGLVFIGAIVYWLSMLFLSGGILHLFIHEKSGTIASVLGNSARYFPRMIRLSLWSLPVLGILLSVQFIYSGIQRLIFGSDPYQSVLYWGAWIKVALRFIIFWVFVVIIDYARIHLVQNDERKTRKSLLAALRFVIKNPGKAFGLKALLIVSGIFALVIYNLLQIPLSNSAGAGLFVLFFIQQIYMIFRSFLRLATFSSQAELYQDAESQERIDNAEEILLAV